MKKPWLAFLLNFLIPGAGLAYLGMWGWAVLNLVVALLLGVVMAAAAPDAIGPLSAGLAAASGGLAMALAQNTNAKAPLQNAGLPPQPAGAPAYFPPLPVRASPVRVRAHFCGFCGADAGSSKFCPQCGSPMHAAAPEPRPLPDPPALPVTVPSPVLAGARAQYCGNCGADVGASKFCPQCGAKAPSAALPASDPASQAAPVIEEAVAPRAKFCGDCGADVGTSKFCPQCGTKVKSAVRSANRCAGCGAVFQSATKFCPECGARAGG
jgi:predicted amidophosphoribosyltransferase